MFVHLKELVCGLLFPYEPRYKFNCEVQ